MNLLEIGAFVYELKQQLCTTEDWDFGICSHGTPSTGGKGNNT